MDHYEELGVTRTASPEEIRQAYKHLVRLLHPDRCADEPARQLAEIQTKRLNGILELLTDADRRSQYDLRLSRGQGCRGNARPLQGSPVPGWFWPAFGIAVLVAVVFTREPRRAESAGRVMVEAPPPVAALPAPVKPEVAGGWSGKTARHRPPPRIAAPAEEERVVSRDWGATAEPAVPGPRPPPAALANAVPVEVKAPAPRGSPMAGDWLLIPSAVRTVPGLYPPEYIEMRVAEQSGMLRGRYRARYRVPDRLISPNVAFQFEGAGGPGEVVLPWHGGGGAQGRITLRLVDPDRLEVSWETGRMGDELGLISGKATLVRKLE